MISANGPTRRGTIKSFKNVFGLGDDTYMEEVDFTTECSPGLKAFTLPQSIPTLNEMSPKLWNWINTTEGGDRTDNPVVFSPAGEIVAGPTPQHLLKGANNGTQRKPVGEDLKEDKYFFVNLKNVNIKKNTLGERVICVLSIDDYKVTSTPLDLSPKLLKSTLKTCYGASCREGFLIKIPKHKAQVFFNIRVYSSNENANHLKHSNSTLFKKSTLSLFSSMKKSESMAVDHSSELQSEVRTQKLPADPSTLGTLIGEHSMVIPTSHAFSKVDMNFAISTSKKDTGKVYLSTGMTLACEYSPKKEIPQILTIYRDYLNFYLLTGGGLIWDKKWVVASAEGLTVHSINNREDSSPIAYIPYKQLNGIQKAVRELMAAPYCMELSIAVPWHNDNSKITPTNLSCVWKDQMAEAGNPSENEIRVYISADDEQRMNHWQKFLNFHIERNYSGRR